MLETFLRRQVGEIWVEFPSQQVDKSPRWPTRAREFRSRALKKVPILAGGREQLAPW